MRIWLSEREQDGDEVERVIDILTDSLALDDVRFSRAFADDKRELAGWGSKRIESVLRSRGVDANLARQAASAGEESEVDRAVRVLEGRSLDLVSDRGRGRALGVLARRGYSPEDAHAAIRILRKAS